jgi:hypothetical protein
MAGTGVVFDELLFLRWISHRLHPLYARPRRPELVCAECGCELAFGESYTSRLIHNDLGFGYAVCPRCYEAEFREMGESCDL